MSRLRLTLLSDGPTDQALLPILRWLIRRNSVKPFEQNWADLYRWPRRPSRLAERVDAALELYPCELLVVHRDAEREPAESRLLEIAEATRSRAMPVVAAVPVRMTEAWLLFDEAAIRRAAGCPNGTMPLNLPALKLAESLPNPKEVLNEALKTASALPGVRRKRFHPDIRRLADLIDDFNPLYGIPSFCALQENLRGALLVLGLLRMDHAASMVR
jgi:hypothetical protein